MSTGIILEHVSLRELFISIIKNKRAYFVTKFKFPVSAVLPNKIFEEYFLMLHTLSETSSEKKSKYMNFLDYSRENVPKNIMPLALSQTLNIYFK